MGSLKSYKTLKNKEFSSIYNEGKKWHCKGAVIFYKSSLEKKVGFVASKKVGNAVLRASCKRRLRAIFLSLQDEVKTGEYIFVSKNDMLNYSYQEIEKNIRWSLRKLKCFFK